jgi:hypothetical protein
MKNFTKTILISAISVMLVSALWLQSCKKKKDPDPTPTPTPTNYLCDGTGQSNYFPLKTGNKWDYNESGTGAESYEVNLNKTFGGHTYFEVKYKTPMDNLNYYYRMDSVGNIIRYYEPDLADYLYLPANPAAGQIIATYSGGGSRKVTGLNQTLSIGNCTYTGLVKIEDFTPANVSLGEQYYKKGFGAVQYMGYFQPAKITAVTFK